MANTYLNRTPSSSGSNTTWTFSCWYKKTSLGLDTVPWATGYTSPQIDEAMINIGADDQLRFNINVNDLTDVTVKSSRKLRDVSAWYHIVVACDTTQGTASNRIKFYINGELETNLSVTDYPTQNQSTFFGDTNKTQLIGVQPRTSNYLQGELSHVAFVDGAALAPTVFGETDSTSGIWKWKEITGVTWGTNGFYFKFENSGNLGLDSSGNSNTFTVNGSATKNIDNPSINYATYNPLNNTGVTLTQGNLTGTYSTNDANIRSTLGVSTGKWYWETKFTTGTGAVVGVCNEDVTQATDRAGSTGFYGIQNANTTYAYYRQNGSTGETSAYPNPVQGNIVNVALDLDNSKMYIGINGVYKNQAGTTSDIANGTNPFFSGIASSVWFPILEYRGGGTTTDSNFGNGNFGTTAITSAGSNGNGSLFEYDVPSGYYALNTKNINTYG